jgi:hypothetical protein
MSDAGSIEENEYYLEWAKYHLDDLGPNTVDARPREGRVEEFYKGIQNSMMARKELAKKYAWAVPTNSALQLITKYGPIIEMGAGTGYWAHLLREAGCHVWAFDRFPPVMSSLDNHWHAGASVWTDVREGSVEVLELPYYRGATLFLCWPPYDHPLAYRALQAYQGDRVIYIGEDDGCTADELFHEVLRKDWNVIDEADPPIPQWYGVHDTLQVFERKKRVR